MHEIILDILKRKITAGEITADGIKNAEYKVAIETWLETVPQEPAEQHE